MFFIFYFLGLIYSFRKSLMFITTEDTPNPQVKKFIIQQFFNHLMSYKKADLDSNAEIHDLARALLSLTEVEEVMMVENTVIVTKNKDCDWFVARTSILRLFMDYFLAGNDIASDSKSKPTETDNQDLDMKDENVLALLNVIDNYILPAVMMDGGHVSLVSFEKEQGVANVRFSGACSGCPSSQMTLKDGIERTIKHHLPFVVTVNAV